MLWYFTAYQHLSLLTLEGSINLIKLWVHYRRDLLRSSEKRSIVQHPPHTCDIRDGEDTLSLTYTTVIRLRKKRIRYAESPCWVSTRTTFSYLNMLWLKWSLICNTATILNLFQPMAHLNISTVLAAHIQPCDNTEAKSFSVITIKYSRLNWKQKGKRVFLSHLMGKRCLSVHHLSV